MADLRLRVEFEAWIGGQQVFLRRWFQPHEGACRVSELIEQIADEFQLRTRTVLLSLRGVALAPETSVTLLRDGDIILVTANNTLELTGTALDVQQAANTAPGQVVEAPLLRGSTLSPEKRHSQHTAGLPLPKPSSKKDGAKTAEAKTKGKKRKAAEDLERDTQEKVPAKTSSRSGKGLATSEEDESGSDLGAADPIPGPVQPGIEHLSHSQTGRSLASEGRPTPSRSARRKKLKRQLIRQGVLPQTKRKRSSALDSAPAAAVLPPVVQPALPRRGDHTADHSKHADFLRTGHIRFAESDGEAPAEESEESFNEDGEAAEPPAHKEAESTQWRLPAPPARGGVHPIAPGADERGSQQPVPQTRHHINYEEMAREEGLPSVGSIVAYKLLEIDAYWSPQVSEWRQGKAVAVDAAELQVELEPWPDRSQHPDASRRPLAAESHEDEDEWEEELPPSDYDDKGVLTTTLSSFADLRSIARGPRPCAVAAAADSPPWPAIQQVSREPPTEQPQAARQTGQPALPEIASGSGRATVSPRMVPRVLRHPEQPAAQTCSGLPQQTMVQSGIGLGSAALKATATANGTHDGQALRTPAATPDPSAAAVVVSGGRKVLVRSIPRIQRGQSTSPANGASTADRQPSGAPTASAGPSPDGSDHRGELAAAIAKRRAELLAAVSSCAAAGLPDGRTGDKEPATTMNVEAQAPASKQAAAEVPASVAITKASANGTHQVMTPGATKPRPGVKRASMGAFLARLRAENE